MLIKFTPGLIAENNIWPYDQQVMWAIRDAKYQKKNIDGSLCEKTEDRWEIVINESNWDGWDDYVFIIDSKGRVYHNKGFCFYGIIHKLAKLFKIIK